ncbi:hypothetical protein J2P12_03375 [Candidatus Bathyarchaeota archaeon]|nr:hypothetical protein [Candidatus Bathyarchaeota archaeon]
MHALPTTTSLRPKTYRIIVAVIGFVSAIGSIAWYQLNAGSQSVIGTDRIPFLEETSYLTLGLFIIGLALMFGGITWLLRAGTVRVNGGDSSSYLERLSWAINDRRSVIMFALTALGYGILFGLVSGTLVFEPGLALSKLYGVKVPSLVAVVCCDSFGQMPQLVAYVTENFAVRITPLNLGILLMVSWLVGLNAALASKVYSQKRRMFRAGWSGGLGAFVGLFTICPTCAGFPLLTVLGLSGSVGLPLAFSWMQLVLIFATVPILVATSVLLLRQVSDSNPCRLDNVRQTVG